MTFEAGERELLIADLTEVMREYERANNTHHIENVLPFIAEDASCWFSDGSHLGLREISAAIDATFHVIQDELYAIDDLVWVVVRSDVAVCRYRFSWTGLIEGESVRGIGRGTNVFVRTDGRWLIIHEQLTSDS